MTRDEELYPDAGSFKPERFMKDGALNKEIRDPRNIVFGFGRRRVFFRYTISSLKTDFFSSSPTLEYVQAATWLSASSGCQLQRSWQHLRLLNPTRLCCLKTESTLLPTKVYCELFLVLSLVCQYLCERQYRHTVPFKCNIKPRSRMSLDMIKSLQSRDFGN
jgi:hypothetical protein